MSSPDMVTQSITINAPASKVWKTLTDPASFRQWLSDKEMNIISDRKAGSPIIFEGNWEGKIYQDKGVIVKFDIEKAFEYTYWTKISRRPDSPENYTVISFELIPEESQTILRVTHSNLTAEAAYEHSNYYWKVTLPVIKKMVEAG